MKTYYIIDDMTTKAGRYDEDKINASTLEEAVRAAIDNWMHMSDSERSRRDAYSVGYGEEDEDNVISYDNIIDIAALASEPCYILKDLDGYGNAEPVCVRRAEAEHLLAEWCPDDDADFDDIWEEASAAEIAKYGVSEG